MDHVTPAIRSKIMSSIRSKNTQPEMKIRRSLHKLGYRYRLHVSDLPGCPDIVLPKYRLAIQVRGCFWHGHRCTPMPKSNTQFWKDKIYRNKKRDTRNDRKIRKLGWRLAVIWECKINTTRGLNNEIRRIQSMLNPVKISLSYQRCFDPK